MDTNKMREQFEAWHSAKFGWLPRHYAFYWNDTYYKDEDFQEAWEVWKASREAVVVEMPCDRSFSASDDPWFVREQCKGAIEDQGLKVKS